MHFKNMINQVVEGDARKVLPEIPDESIDMAITSPPYWGLRSYEGTETIWDGDENCEHEWGETVSERVDKTGFKRNRRGLNKAAEIADGNPRNATTNIPPVKKESQFCQKCGAFKGQLGLEPSPELYTSHLLQIFRELKRVLKPTGSFFLNIGDTYSGSNQGYGTTKRNIDSGFQDARDGYYASSKQKPPQSKMKIPRKCLCMMPERVAMAMINEGFILRNKIIWKKGNPMPSSVRDRLNTTWEYLYHFTIKPKYFYDLDAIREEHKQKSLERVRYNWNGHREPMSSYEGMDIKKMCHGAGKNPGDFIETKDDRLDRITKGLNRMRSAPNPGEEGSFHPKGKNPGDIFTINTSPFPGAHFAKFPGKLVEKPIKAACPKEVCKKCGEGRKKIREKIGEKQRRWSENNAEGSPYNKQDSYSNVYEEGGYINCGCENPEYEPGIVLDPFAGTGTVGRVAQELARNYILIEISPKYAQMARNYIEWGDDYGKIKELKEEHKELENWIGS